MSINSQKEIFQRAIASRVLSKDPTRCLTAVLQQHLGTGNRRKGFTNFPQGSVPAYILIETFPFQHFLCFRPSLLTAYIRTVYRLC